MNIAHQNLQNYTSILTNNICLLAYKSCFSVQIKQKKKNCLTIYSQLTPDSPDVPTKKVFFFFFFFKSLSKIANISVEEIKNLSKIKNIYVQKSSGVSFLQCAIKSMNFEQCSLKVEIYALSNILTFW